MTAERLVVKQHFDVSLPYSALCDLQERLGVDGLPDTVADTPLVVSEGEHAELTRAAATTATGCIFTRAGAAILDVINYRKNQSYLTVTTLTPSPERAAIIHSCVRRILQDAVEAENASIERTEQAVDALGTVGNIPLDAISTGVCDSQRYDVTWFPSDRPPVASFTSKPYPSPNVVGMTEHPVKGRNHPTTIVFNIGKTPVTLRGTYRPRQDIVECTNIQFRNHSDVRTIPSVLEAIPALPFDWPRRTGG